MGVPTAHIVFFFWLSTQTLPHLAFNSIALYSFGTACFSYLNYSDTLPRSTSRFEFLAFFAAGELRRCFSSGPFLTLTDCSPTLLKAGLASSFASHVWFSRVIAGRLAQIASPLQVRSSIVPSLGASGQFSTCLTLLDFVLISNSNLTGAVYSCLTLTALSFPESNVSLIFIPFIPLPIGTASSTKSSHLGG